MSAMKPDVILRAEILDTPLPQASLTLNVSHSGPRGRVGDRLTNESNFAPSAYVTR